MSRWHSVPRRPGTTASGTPSTTTSPRSPLRPPACSSPTSPRTRSTIRLGAGGIMLPNHSPLVDRRAVRHAGDPAPRTHRPRPRPRAGHRPEHDARAAPRPHLGGRVPARRAGAPGLPHRRDAASPASTPSPARAPTCRCTSSARRCSARSSPPPSDCRTRSRRTSRPTRCGRPSRRTARSSGRRRSCSEPYVIAGVNVDRRRRRGRRAGAVPHDEAPAREPAVGSPRPQVHRRGGRPDPRLARTARTSSNMIKYTAVGTPEKAQGLPRRLRRPRRRRRTHHGPPVAHRQAATPLRGTSGAGRGSDVVIR